MVNEFNNNAINLKKKITEENKLNKTMMMLSTHAIFYKQHAHYLANTRLSASTVTHGHAQNKRSHD